MHSYIRALIHLQCVRAGSGIYRIVLRSTCHTDQSTAGRLCKFDTCIMNYIPFITIC